jgi:hypothetical protein
MDPAWTINRDRPTTGFGRPQRQSRYGLQIGIASDASRLPYSQRVIASAPTTGFGRPQRQSRYGLQIGIASDAS